MKNVIIEFENSSQREDFVIWLEKKLISLNDEDLKYGKFVLKTPNYTEDRFLKENMKIVVKYENY